MHGGPDKEQDGKKAGSLKGLVSSLTYYQANYVYGVGQIYFPRGSLIGLLVSDKTVVLPSNSGTR